MRSRYYVSSLLPSSKPACHQTHLAGCLRFKAQVCKCMEPVAVFQCSNPRNAWCVLPNPGGAEDYIEAFNMGRDIPSSGRLRSAYYQHMGAGAASVDDFLPPDNRWPTPVPLVPPQDTNAVGDQCALVRRALVEYYDASSLTAYMLLEALAVALGVDPNTFVQFHGKHDHTLELKRYHALSSRLQSPVRMSAHSDLSSLTLLVEHGYPGGLEVWDRRTDQWLQAQCHWEASKGSVLVNTGEFMRDWTSGYFPSTWHRVVQSEQDADTSGTPERSSIVLFTTPDWDVRVAPLTNDKPTHANSEDTGGSTTEEYLVGDRMPFS